MQMTNIILPFFTILFIIIPIIIIYVVFKYFKRAESRANEKLELEKQSTITLQKRVDELNTRLITIENILKEVE